MTPRIITNSLRASVVLAAPLLVFLAMLPGAARAQNEGYLAGGGKGEYKRTTPLADIPPYALQEVHRGMTFGFLAKNGYFSSDEAMEQVDRMAALGVKWVSLVVIPMQENLFSTRVYNDYEYTASDGELELMINRLHAKGIRVMLYTCLEMHDSHWRGEINFPKDSLFQQIQGIRTDYWPQWFKSYTAALVNYGRLAQRKGVELFCLGAEMNCTVNENEHWSRLIDEVRKVYKGPLVYEACGPIDFDHLPAWYKKLDMIGYSFYRPAADKPGATIKEMVKFLQADVAEMRKLSEMTGRPLVFTECGTGSYKGATVNPEELINEGKSDSEEQARYAEAVLSAFWNEPWWRGLYWWKWDEHQYRPQQHTDPTGDQTNTVAGKPVAETLKKWYLQTDRP